MPGETSKDGGARVRIPPPVVFLSLTIAGALVQRFVHPLTTSLPALALVPVGIVIAVAGLALIAAAVGRFRRSGQDLRPWTPTPSLIVEGPYRFTRNPMYLGMTSIMIGIGVALNDLWIVGGAPAALAIVHVLVVLPEEAYLARAFGASYDDYRRKVRRYL